MFKQSLANHIYLKHIFLPVIFKYIG